MNEWQDVEKSDVWRRIWPHKFPTHPTYKHSLTMKIAGICLSNSNTPGSRHIIPSQHFGGRQLEISSFTIQVKNKSALSNLDKFTLKQILNASNCVPHKCTHKHTHTKKIHCTRKIQTFKKYFYSKKCMPAIHVFLWSRVEKIFIEWTIKK